ncbi:MAG: UbiA prenyltransferase family protein [Deltaproteobacteria bacterium]|nr:UbiA prenyltransferase family protein [Deltaproteobacteria bacterium]
MTRHPLWVLARPAMLPYLWLLVLAGYGWAHWDRALTFRGGEGLVAVLLAWGALHAGTLWLNAGLDRDEGPVLFGEPVPVPRWIRTPGLVALALSVGLGAWAGCVEGVAAGIAAALAVLYSRPERPWKGHQVLGPLVNWVGYGLLSPLVGWAVVRVSPDPRTLLAWLFGSLGVLGVYFLAQVFQQEEDRARGYRTLVATHGPALTLAVGHLLLGAGVLGGVGLTALGWLPRVSLVLLPLGVWNSWGLWRWGQRLPDASPAEALAAVRRLLALALVALVVNLAWYAWECQGGGPVAGLATADGLPDDRPAWPPRAMRAWERAHDPWEDRWCP